MPEPSFTFDPVSSRFRGPGGRFVSDPAVRTVLDRTLANGGLATRGLTEGLASGNLSLQQWRTAMMGEIRASQVAAAALSRGGFAQLSQADHGWIGSQVKKQYVALRRFAGQLATGAAPLDGRALARAEMYAESARATHREMLRRLARLSGDEEERNELGAADHCGGCLDAASQGWVPIGSLPAVGSRDCLSRCHCVIETRRQPAAEAAA